MQKLAPASKNSGDDTRTAFVSRMFDYFLENFKIKSSKIIIDFIKTQTQ